MPGPHNRNLKTDLALAVAGGKSVAAWAQEHNIPRRTAYTWAKSPEFKAAVESYRRRANDRAVGRLVRYATWAVTRLVKLAKGAKSEAVQLAATRAILMDRLAIADNAELERRMADIERQLRERASNPTDPS